MQFGDASAAGDPVHHTGTNEIRPRPAEAAGDADCADGLIHILPLVAADAHAIAEMHPIVFGTQIDRGDRFAVAGPLPAARPASAQAAGIRGILTYGVFLNKLSWL
jgi:hypothetical protein